MAYSNDRLLEIACAIIKGNRYLVMGTSSRSGMPWTAPVQFAVDNADGFYWVSALNAVHSKNILENPRVSLVIFDSRAPQGAGQGLYGTADAVVLTGRELEAGCNLFYAHKYPDPVIRAREARRPDELSGGRPRRMFKAVVTQYSILDPDFDPSYDEPVDLRVALDFTTAIVSQMRTAEQVQKL